MPDESAELRKLRRLFLVLLTILVCHITVVWLSHVNISDALSKEGHVVTENQAAIGKLHAIVKEDLDKMNEHQDILTEEKERTKIQRQMLKIMEGGKAKP
jgi:hypothetical protein